MKVRFVVSIAALAWSASCDQVVEVPAEGEDRAGEPTRAEFLGFLESGIVVPVPVEPETATAPAAPSTAVTPPAPASTAAPAPPETAATRKRRTNTPPARS